MRKNRKELIRFAIFQSIAGLSFVPYLIISFQNALSEKFNILFNTLSLETLYDTMVEFFDNGIYFSLFIIILIVNIIICFMPKINKNKAKQNLLIYLLYSIVTFFIIVYLITTFVKPIYISRVAANLYSLLFIMEIVLISSVVEFKNPNPVKILSKLIYSLLVCGLIFSMTKPVVPMRIEFNLYQFIDFVKNDAPKYKNDYKIHAIIPDYIEYLKEYPQIADLKYINWHIIKVNEDEFIPLKTFINNDKTVIYPFLLTYIFHGFGEIDENMEFYFYRCNMFNNIKVLVKGKR